MNIEIKNIGKSFGRKTVLENISFSCKSGEIIGILGENGSGKSTLFGVLTGLHRGKGSFICDGVDMIKDSKLRSKTVGFVPQSPPLLNELSGLDNLRLWYSSKELKKELDEGVLNMLGISEFAKTTVAKMSGGMKKRLSIGCSVAHDPRILFLDEPTAALDLVCKENIARYLNSFVKTGGIAVIATHDVAELNLCDRLYILKNGRLTEYTGKREADEIIKYLI